MGFTKVKYGEEEVFELEVKDVNRRVIDRWVVMKRDFSSVVKILNDKYGLGMIIKTKKPIDDLDWALK